MKSEGVCSYCKETFSGSGMSRHLQSCAKRKSAHAGESGGNVFLIKAGACPFWVYFEVIASSKLRDIDIFLRNLWLECCGHMSAFTIDSIRYYSSAIFLEDDEKDMNVPLADVISPEVDFFHEYDFGTTTELDLKCISERRGRVKGIKVLARNNMPEIVCYKCGKPAKKVCSQCIWEGEGFLCGTCARKHECGEEMLLPVVNSPRMGMCGYTGEESADTIQFDVNSK